jgi:hypothetical protein
MTLFEYMSVAIAIIVALAFAEGLRGLQSALDPDRRYGIHVTWIFIKLANPIFYWWGTWGLRDFPDFWNMATFSMMLIMPSIMYLQLHSLVSDNPDQVEDWRKHFYAQRRWLFGLNTLLAAFAILVFANISVPAPAQLLPVAAYAVICALSIAGFVSDNPKLHAAIALFVAVFTFFYYGFVTFRPSSFA